MIARFEKRDVVTILAAIATAAFCIWGIMFMGGEIVKMHQEYPGKVAIEKEQAGVTEDMHEPMVIPEESVYDDNTGTYGQHIRPNGTLGTGYDMGGGVVIKPNGEIGFGFGF